MPVPDRDSPRKAATFPAPAARRRASVRTWTARRTTLLTAGLAVGLGVAACTRQAPRNEAQLSWSPPTERVDGSALERIEAYRIAWGRRPGGPYAAGERHISAEVAAPDSPAERASATVRGLAPGRWCFVVYAIDESGRESKASPEACKDVGR